MQSKLRPEEGQMETDCLRGQKASIATKIRGESVAFGIKTGWERTMRRGQSQRCDKGPSRRGCE